MSRAAANGNVPAVLADLSLGARLSSIALLPITAGLIVLGPAFTSVILLDKVLPFAFVMLQQRVFYAMRDTKTPTLINLIMVATKVALVLAANQLFSSRGAVIIALTVATSTSYLVGAIAGQLLLKRRFGLLGFRPVARTLGWVGLATLPAALTSLAVVWAVNNVLGVNRVSALVEVIGGGGIGLVILLVIASRLPLPEIAGMRSGIQSRRGGH
jgi:putative peptidoglycan lipid II flippase